MIASKDGRVRLLFTPEAREAVEKVEVTPYVERIAASDNLRCALSGGGSPADGRTPFRAATAAGGTEAATDLGRSRTATGAAARNREPSAERNHEWNGASDGARTRDLRRDRPAL